MAAYKASLENNKLVLYNLPILPTEEIGIPRPAHTPHKRLISAKHCKLQKKCFFLITTFIITHCKYMPPPDIF